MTYTLELLASIHKLGLVMIHADGKFTEKEVTPVFKFFSKIEGFNDNVLKMILDYAENLTVEKAVEIVSGADDAIKQNISNIMADISESDGDVADEEINVFRTMAELCGLPMPIAPNEEEEAEEAAREEFIPPTYIVARTNGTARPVMVESVDWNGFEREAGAIIGAERLEVVRYTAPLNAISSNLGLNGCHLVFLVDRNGYSRSDAGDNMTGTILYGSGYEIKGDIIFALETDGYEICGIRTKRLVGDIYLAINNAVGGLLRVE